MQPNTKEFLAKMSTENNIGGSKDISLTAEGTQKSPSLTSVTGFMKEAGIKTARRGTAQEAELMNVDVGASMMK